MVPRLRSRTGFTLEGFFEQGSDIARRLRQVTDDPAPGPVRVVSPYGFSVYFHDNTLSMADPGSIRLLPEFPLDMQAPNALYNTIYVSFGIIYGI